LALTENSLKQKAFNGMIWSATDKFASTGISFVFNLLIARILMPEDYGVVAMLGIFMAICGCFIDSGFASALIRKNDRTEADFNTVFYFNIAVALIAYGLLFLTAPLIAKFYAQPLLVKVTRLVGLNLVIGSISSIQSVKLSIDLNFKSRAIISLVSVVFTGAIGLTLALKGLGVMALVFQGLSSSALRTVLLCAIVHWRPRLMFSKRSFKEMFSFGSKLLASGLLDTIYNNVYTLVIGKVCSPAKLGNYSRAESLAGFPSSGITGVLQAVTYPVLSTIQDNEERLRSSYQKFLNMSAFVVSPLMIGFAAVADPFIRLCLTDKWEETIPMMQILCFALMWYPIHAINLNILQVKGRSDYFLRLEIIKKCLGVATLCVTIPMGLTAMCIGRVFTSIVCLPINTYYTKKLIDYGFWQQMKNMMHIILLSLAMGAAVLWLVHILPNAYLRLGIGIPVGVVIYILVAIILKFPEWNDLWGLIKDKIHHNGTRQ